MSGAPASRDRAPDGTRSRTKRATPWARAGCDGAARRRSEVVLIVCDAFITGRVGCMSSPSGLRIWRAACGRSMSERTLSVSSRSGKGLSRNASAPAPTTARMRASERTADSAMNGTPSSPGTARNARSRLSPSMSGIRMSLTTQSGLICATRASAALPVGKAWVSNSGARNARSSSRRTFGSSSTTIIRRGVVISWLASAATPTRYSQRPERGVNAPPARRL